MCKLLWHGIKHLVAQMSRVVVVVLLLLGVTVITEAVTWTPLPSPRRLSAEARQELLVWSDNSSGDLARPLAVLDRVCPEVSVWVRWQQYHGLLTRSTNHKPYIACYYPLFCVLELSPIFNDLSVGEQACTLAHEYRHSRQPWRLFFQHCLFLARRDMVECEAEAFEGEVRLAIHGR